MSYNTESGFHSYHPDPTVELTCEFISRASITPEDAGCQQIMVKRLEALGFKIEFMQFEDTLNLWARRGTEQPLFCFAGHTDVVPTGPEEAWKFPPFTPTIDNNLLYGRGAADMKGSLAAMVVAVEKFVATHPEHKGSISFLITSDEEGMATHGTRRVIETLEQRGEKIHWCLVGEPSSVSKVGDVIKVGRRGSFSGELVIHGKQGHVAYPHLASNPVHLAAPFLQELSQSEWDQGNSFFPATSFQISNIHAGTGAPNVIPGQLNVMFNFRYSTEVTADILKERVTSLLDKHELNYEVTWRNNGLPFLTDHGSLVPAIVDAVESVAGIKAECLTTGGTSDGRFIAPTGAQVAELGPTNASIHQVNENVDISELQELTLMYEATLKNLLTE